MNDENLIEQDSETRDNYESMTLKDLRRYARANKYGITHLSERRKEDVIKILRERDEDRRFSQPNYGHSHD